VERRVPFSSFPPTFPSFPTSSSSVEYTMRLAQRHQQQEGKPVDGLSCGGRERSVLKGVRQEAERTSSDAPPPPSRSSGTSLTLRPSPPCTPLRRKAEETGGKGGGTGSEGEKSWERATKLLYWRGGGGRRARKGVSHKEKKKERGRGC
jgi:hypothetical protein